jgi:glycosyltransferase involved in cell wall biosynthesis
LQLRILHVLKDLRNVGNGVTNAAVDMATVQRELGHTVGVASDPGEYQELLKKNNIAYYQLHHGNRPAPFLRSWFRLRAIVREFRPQIVHCHLAPGTLLAWSARLFTHYSLVSHVHNVEERRSITTVLADGVIAVSDAAAHTMSSRGVPKRKLFVVPNCVVGGARGSSAAASRSSKDLAQPAIVTVAGMNKRKNIDGLIAAFDAIASEFPDAHLYLVGDGEDRSTFQTQAKRSRAGDRIHFEGFQKDPKPYLQSAAIFVLASRRESFGLVLHEAREAGAAIVASNVDGIAEALDHGRAGLLVPVEDTAALSNALRLLLSNPSELDKWRKAAKQGISQHTVRQMGENLLTVYRSLLREEDSPTTAAIFGAGPESSS